uniref:Retrotransposon gag domain-containing protein n=1 Tax=Cajanus cajan TaxID=3821 RepID=A0A151UDN3_CAJCA
MQGTIQTRGTNSSEPLLNDPEIERTKRRNNSNKRRRRNRANPVGQPTTHIPEVFVYDIPKFTMEGEGGVHNDNQNRRRTIGDAFTYTGPGEFSSIVRPTMNDRLAEMKLALLQLISSHQFSGLDHEDPHTHLYIFYELCGSIRVSGADEEALFMRLFPFSLNGKAKAWLHSQPNQSLTTWRDVETKFLASFFPPSKNTEARTAIATFAQGADEPLCEAWERYKSLLRRCPNHGFEVELQVQTFCNGLQPQTKMILDASFGGSVMFRTDEEAITIIESMASTDFRSQHDRSSSHKRGVLELSTQDVVLAQNKIVSQ